MGSSRLRWRSLCQTPHSHTDTHSHTPTLTLTRSHARTPTPLSLPSLRRVGSPKGGGQEGWEARRRVRTQKGGARRFGPPNLEKTTMVPNLSIFFPSRAQFFHYVPSLGVCSWNSVCVSEGRRLNNARLELFAQHDPENSNRALWGPRPSQRQAKFHSQREGNNEQLGKSDMLDDPAQDRPAEGGSSGEVFSRPGWKQTKPGSKKNTKPAETKRDQAKKHNSLRKKPDRVFQKELFKKVTRFKKTEPDPVKKTTQ